MGIAGIAMASVAGLLKEKGHDVVGSDESSYPPAADFLKRLRIPVYSPYHPKNLKKAKPDMVVVGNAVGRGHAELEALLESGIPYRSMSEILTEEFIEGKKAIVITGTHGKTTTTSLVAWILECAGLDPTLFVGGIAKNFASSFKLGTGDCIVLEGDEYDTAFFDKGPKFWHYRPYVGLVNNIELDHVDIYKDLDAVTFAFARFMNLIPRHGLLVVNRENKNAHDLAQEKARSPVRTVGITQGDYTARTIVYGSKTSCMIYEKGKSLGVFTSDLLGQHNIENILAAVAIARFLKIPASTIRAAVARFAGVTRRADIIGVKNSVTVIDDYAHHPTAVRETLEGLRKKFPKQRLLAIFEPGSASSKRRIFEKDYINAFTRADLVYIYKPYSPGALKKQETFHSAAVAEALKKHGVPARSFDGLEPMLVSLKKEKLPGDVIVIMSCRGFDGLYKKIWDVL